MSTVATLFVKLGLDSKGYKSGLDSAMQKTSAAGKTMMKTGAVMTAGLTVPLIGAAVAATKMAVDLQESQNAVNVIFGDSASVIEEYGKTVARTTGLSTADFFQMSAQSGAMLQNLGFDLETATDETIKLTQRAADMASIFNTDVDQALAAIQSALKGEFNPLEQFAVTMKASTIEAKALSMGLVPIVTNQTAIMDATVKYDKALAKHNKTLAKYGEESIEARETAVKSIKATENLQKATEGNIGEMTQAMKTTATLAILYEQTDRFAGDFAATSQDLANATKIAKAEFTNAAAALGTELLPIGLKIVTFVSDLISKFSALTPEQKKNILIIGGIVAAIGPLIAIIGGIITVVGTIGTIVAAVFSPIGLIIVAIIAVVALLAWAWKNNFGGIRDKVEEFWGKIKPIFETLKEWLAIAIPAALEFLSDIWNNSLLPAIKKIWSFLQDNVFPLFRSIAKFLKAVFGLAFRVVAGYIKNVWLPQFLKLVDYFKKHVLPVIKKVANWLKEKLKPAFAFISDKVKDLIGWLKRMTDKLNGLALPSWLEPGSPTPFELGLLGINDALKKVVRQGLPDLNMGLQLAPVGGAGGVPGRADTTGDDPMLSVIYTMLRSLPDDLKRGNRDLIEKLGTR